MKYIINFFKKEQDFFKASVFFFIGSFFMLFVNNIFAKYNIISRDCALIPLLIGFSINFYAIGIKLFIKKEK